MYSSRLPILTHSVIVAVLTKLTLEMRSCPHGCASSFMVRGSRHYGVANPFRVPDCGLPLAGSVNVMVPVRFTPRVANRFVKFTPTVQEAPAARFAFVQ